MTGDGTNLYMEIKRHIMKIFLSEYNSISHCMIDFRINESRRPAKKNIILERLCSDFAIITNNFESFGHKKYY